MGRRLQQFLRDENGATAIEYGLIAALIALVIITSIGLFGQHVQGLFEFISNNVVPVWQGAGQP